MKQQFGTFLVLSAMVVAPLFGGTYRTSITVLVYNYASVSAETLAQTKAEADRIYRSGGIEIEFFDCPFSKQEAPRFPVCSEASRPATLALRILPESMTAQMRQHRDSYGFAVHPDDGSFAIIANVFAHEAETLSERRNLRCGIILGHLVTHEIGHLLLGGGGHSNTGIMRASWKTQELETVARGLMSFQPWEFEKMRTNIAIRKTAAAALPIRAPRDLQ